MLAGVNVIRRPGTNNLSYAHWGIFERSLSHFNCQWASGKRRTI